VFPYALAVRQLSEETEIASRRRFQSRLAEAVRWVGGERDTLPDQRFLRELRCFCRASSTAVVHRIIHDRFEFE
jgi:hypothetical protein